VVATVSAFRPVRLPVATLPCAHSPWAPVRIHRVDSTRIAEAGTLPGRQTLRALTGTAQWTPLGPARALPDRQEDRLAPHEDNERGGFLWALCLEQSSCA
jgi:hypothetical protein